MWFKKPKAAVCTVCGKVIAPAERRFVDKNRITKVERHTHIACRTSKPQQQQAD